MTFNARSQQRYVIRRVKLVVGIPEFPDYKTRNEEAEGGEIDERHG
jgi:hypothetical protein